MIHTRTKIIALISLGFFVATLCIFSYFIWLIQGHKKNINEERYRAAEAESQVRTLSALEALVASTKEERAKIRGFILEDEEIIDLLSLIEQTAREQGVVLSTDNLTVSALDETFEELHITVSLSGSFDGVMRVLRILESLPEQSTIPQVTLSRFEEESTIQWQGSILIHVTKFKKV